MVKVEIYDEEHEKDLQYKINNFLSKVNESDVIDIKYSIHAFSSYISTFTIFITFKIV